MVDGPIHVIDNYAFHLLSKMRKIYLRLILVFNFDIFHCFCFSSMNLSDNQKMPNAYFFFVILLLCVCVNDRVSMSFFFNIKNSSLFRYSLDEFRLDSSLSTNNNWV